MTAEERFPYLAWFASGVSGSDRDLIERRREAAAALSEIDRLSGLLAAGCDPVAVELPAPALPPE